MCSQAQTVLSTSTYCLLTGAGCCSSTGAFSIPVVAGDPLTPYNFSKYCACHAKWISWWIRITYETSFTLRGATYVSPSNLTILHLPCKIALPNLREVRRKRLKYHLQCVADSTMIRAWNCKTEPAGSASLLFHLPATRFVWKLQHFALRLSIQISPDAAPATKSDTPTSPNVAPATQSETPTSPKCRTCAKSDNHDEWSCSHIKRHLQCVEQQVSPSNLTKYCTCHAKLLSSWLMPVTFKRYFQCAEQQAAPSNLTILLQPKKTLQHKWYIEEPVGVPSWRWVRGLSLDANNEVFPRRKDFNFFFVYAAWLNGSLSGRSTFCQLKLSVESQIYWKRFSKYSNKSENKPKKHQPHCSLPESAEVGEGSLFLGRFDQGLVGNAESTVNRPKGKAPLVP